MNLIDVHKTFTTDDQCTEYLSKLRWPDGIRCLTCGTDKVKQYLSPTTKQPGRKIYQCQEPTCQQQFTATSGTIFHDTHLPLTKWFMALALIVDAKKGMSAKQLQRHLCTGYKTAWYLAHRIRKAMEETGSPLLSGTVEMDECYIGGKQRGHKGKRVNKDVVVGIRQRGGPLRFVHTKDATGETLFQVANRHLGKDIDKIMTDDNRAYSVFKVSRFTGKHSSINHSAGEYVKGQVHTNTIENAFSLLKRGVVGTYHQLSIKHLQAYLNEFEYRFNRRENPDRFEETLSRMAKAKPMPFESLIAKEAAQ